jgi:hypothetical protein
MFELCGLNLDLDFQIICGVQFVVHETYAIEILLVKLWRINRNHRVVTCIPEKKGA